MSFRKTRPNYWLSHTVVEGWTIVLQPRELGTLVLLTWPWTCLYTKAFWSKAFTPSQLSHATGHWSQAQQQIYSKMGEKKRIKMLQWPCQRPNLNLIQNSMAGLSESCTKHNEMRQQWKIVMGQKSSTVIWETDKVIQTIITSSYSLLFYKLLNHRLYDDVGIHRTAESYENVLFLMTVLMCPVFPCLWLNLQISCTFWVVHEIVIHTEK